MVGLLGRADADLAISNLFVSSLEGRDEYQGYTTFFDTDVSPSSLPYLIQKG